MGRAYNLLIRLFAIPGLKDTQCGFKCYRGQVAEELFSIQRLTGFGYDVEVLFLARRRGLRMCEVPIQWHYRSHGKVRPVRDTLSMTYDILRIRWSHLLGKYSSD